MNNLKMFCITMRNEDLSLIESLGYIPVGLGNNTFSKKIRQGKTYQIKICQKYRNKSKRSCRYNWAKNDWNFHISKRWNY